MDRIQREEEKRQQVEQERVRLIDLQREQAEQKAKIQEQIRQKEFEEMKQK